MTIKLDAENAEFITTLIGGEVKIIEDIDSINGEDSVSEGGSSLGSKYSNGVSLKKLPQNKKGNTKLHKAKKGKNDEFYTQLEDIESEVSHYKEHFNNKIVFCNSDDPEESQFYFYFAQNFEKLGLKKLITTHYNSEKNSYKLEIVRDINNDGKINKLDTIKTELQGNGDFRSDESIDILKEADIVVTNPPFSLFREYISQLIEYNKKFLLLGNMNAITYKEVFTLIKNKQLWAGYGFNLSLVFKSPYENELEGNRQFCESKGYSGKKYIKVPSINWFTNLEHSKRNEELVLYKIYKGNEKNYQKYDNYDAINIDKVKEIPLDYEGEMGVPITFLGKYNPDQFEIVTMSTLSGTDANYWTKINGKPKFSRIFIKNKKFN